MRAISSIYQMESVDCADVTVHHIDICRMSGEGLDVRLIFPDRTPRDKLQAIAKAINDALSAARELEALGRD